MKEIKNEEKIVKNKAVKKEEKETALTKPKKVNTAATEKVKTAEKKETKKPVVVEEKTETKKSAVNVENKKVKTDCAEIKKLNFAKISKIFAIVTSSLFVLVLILAFAINGSEGFDVLPGLLLILIPLYLPLTIICGVNTVKNKKGLFIASVVLLALFGALYAVAFVNLVTGL